MRSHQEGLPTTNVKNNNNNSNDNGNKNININNTVVVDSNILQKDTKTKSSKCKLVKGIKPLINYKFYLDIEKHNIFLKIESKIRELGGSIEFFLTKNITHFVTDKKESINNCVESQEQSPVPSGATTPQTPSTPNYLSPTVNKTPSSNDLKINSKIRTRADAMLHRARKGTCEINDNINKIPLTINSAKKITTTTTSITTNPSHIAESWGIPLWHTEYALKFLEKVYTYVKGRHTNDNSSTQVFKGNYIKIESIQKDCYRPYYKILNSKWPVLNLKPHKKGVFPLTAVNENYFYNSETKTVNKRKSKATTTATKPIKIFSNQVNISSISEVKMTKKSRISKHIRVKTTANTATTNTTNTTTTTTSNKQNNLSSEKQCGFCEICRVEYDALTIHLKSESHQNFVKNENNFLALDSLIKSSADMDKFLSLNSRTGTQFETANNAYDIYSTAKRTSKRISNNGSQIKQSTLPFAIPPSSPPPLLPVLQVQSPSSTKDKSSPKKEQQTFQSQQQQIEILEKTTTLGHTRQTRKQSSNNHQNHVQLQIPPFDDEYENSLAAVRARRQSIKKINYAEPKEDEENSVEDLLIGYKCHSKKKKSKSKEKSKSSSKNRRNSESDIKPLSLPTSLLYKVVETNDKKTKLSTKKDVTKGNALTSGKNSKQNEENDECKEEENKQKSPIIVKIRKVRQSELSILSGEAVNFMFPKRRLSSSDPTDDGRQTTSESRGLHSNSIISSSDYNTSFSNKLDEWQLADRVTTLKRKQSNSSIIDDSELKQENKRRRLNLTSSTNEHRVKEEKCTFINEEVEEMTTNYSDKISSPKSLQKSPSLRTYGRRKTTRKKSNEQTVEGNKSPTKTKNDKGNKSTGKKTLPTTPSLTDIINEKLVKYKYSFERIPESELWYQVFRRQDDSHEKIFEYYGSTVYRKLPYEMGPIPPPNKPLCTLCHINSAKDMNKNSSNTTIIASTSKNTRTTIENKSPRKELKSPNKKERLDNVNVSQSEPNSSSIVKKSKRSSISSKAAALLNLEMPRKSPREHASTLAILSCLLRKNAQQQEMPNATTTSVYNKYNSNDMINNEICTQISEDVKRLKRGEKASTSRNNSSSNLLQLQTKNSTKKKNGTRKLPSPSTASSPSKKTSNSSGKSRFGIDEYKINKFVKEDKHVNVIKLKKDIDEYLMSSTLNCDDDFINESLSQPPTCDDSDFIEFSHNIDLGDLLQECEINNRNRNSRSIANDIAMIGNGNFKLIKSSSTNKKRKNKTGWPTTKRRTATRQHTKQQQQKHEQIIESRKSLEDIADIITKSEATTSGITTNTTATSCVTTTTTNTFKCQTGNSSININNISTHSPITPPESDNDDNYNSTINEHTNNDSNDNEEDDEESSCVNEKEFCDDNNVLSTTTNRKNSTLNNHRNLHNSSHVNHNHLPHNHNLHNNLNVSDKTDVSDIFTVSSDSLDTVLDVGSQIKSEDQEEIIASSKYNGNKLNNSVSNSNHNLRHHHHHTTSSSSATVTGIVDQNNDNSEVDKDNHSMNDNNFKNIKKISPPLRKISTSSTSNLFNNAKRIKYSNSNSIKIRTIIGGGSSTSLNFYENHTSNNNRIISRKLSNSSDRKEMNVVVVVKRERNNSISSNSDSHYNNLNHKNRSLSQHDEIKSPLSSSPLSTSSSPSFVETRIIKREETATPVKRIIIPESNSRNNVVSSVTAASTSAAKATEIIASVPTISPRRLRKPRGRWYRER